MEKMTRIERAKQFMPFSALHGFEEIIKRKESVPTSRRELSEEDAEKLNNAVLGLKKGDLVQAEYYSEDRYVITEGVITALDFTLKFIRIVKTEIQFKDLRNIKTIQ